MARIAITGAAGRVGRETLAAFEDTEHEIQAITHRERQGIDSIVADVEEYETIERALRGCDVVIHLAGNPSPGADWERIFHVNIDGTRNVYEAAVTHGLERIIFASTNHVTHMHNVPQNGEWDELVSETKPIRIGDPIRPDSYYAVSKVTGEALGSYYADRHGIEVIDLRIGWYLTREELQERQDEPESIAHYARAIWLSPRDCRHAMRRAVEADLTDTHVTVNVCSRNAEGYLSLVETMRSLDYRPRDDSSEVLERTD